MIKSLLKMTAVVLSMVICLISFTVAAKTLNADIKSEDYDEPIEAKTTHSIIETSDNQSRGIHPLDDGVYAIRNYSSYYYMDVRGNSTKEGTYIQQYNNGSVPNSKEERGSLFKIEHIPDTDRYIIRTMTNNYNEIVPSGSDIVTDSVPASSSQAHTWVISYSGDAYTIAPYNNTTGSVESKYIAAQNTYSSGASGGESSKLKLVSNLSYFAKWYFIPYSGSFFTGCSVAAPTSTTVYSGNPISMTALNNTKYFYSTAVYTNSPGTIAYYSVEDINGNATATATINNAGLLSTVSGKFGLCFVRAYFSTGAVSDRVSVFVKPNNGTYVMIQNIQTINGNQLGCLEVNGTSVAKNNANFDSSQIFALTYPISGQNYVMLQNVATGQYLTSPRNGTEYSAVTMQNMIPFYEAVINGAFVMHPDVCQMWKITTAPSGQMRIQSRYQEMYAPTMYLNLMGNNNPALIQGTCVNNNSYLDEFNVLNVYGGNEEVVVYGADTYDVPPSQDLSAMTIARHLSMTQSSSYDTFAFYPFTNQTVSDVQQKIDQAKIAVIMGHASPTVISINKNQDIYFRNTSLSSLNLSNLELIIFEGCETAGTVTNGYNLPQTAVNRGATAAIGFKQSIMDIVIDNDPGYNSNFYKFNDKLFSELLAGETLTIACQRAAVVGGDFDTYEIYGSKTYMLND